MLKISSGTMKKIAFWNTFNAEKSDYDSAGGYAREYGNRVVGSLAGGLPGTGIAVSGLAARDPRLAIALGLGGGTLALAGGKLGDYYALRASNEAQGVNPSTMGQILGRDIGAAVGSLGTPVGSFLADYYVSRKMQDHEKGRQE